MRLSGIKQSILEFPKTIKGLVGLGPTKSEEALQKKVGSVAAPLFGRVENQKIDSSIRGVFHQCNLLSLGSAHIAKVEMVYHFILPMGSNMKEAGFYDIHGQLLKTEKDKLQEISSLRFSTQRSTREQNSVELKELEKQHPCILTVKRFLLKQEQCSRQLDSLAKNNPDILAIRRAVKEPLGSNLSNFKDKNPDFAKIVKLLKEEQESGKKACESWCKGIPSTAATAEDKKNKTIFLLYSKRQEKEGVLETLKATNPDLEKIRALMFVTEKADLDHVLSDYKKTNPDMEAIQSNVGQIGDIDKVLNALGKGMPSLQKIRELAITTDEKTINASLRRVSDLEGKIEKVFKGKIFAKIQENLSFEFNNVGWIPGDSIFEKVGKIGSWVYKLGQIALCHVVYELTGAIATGNIRHGIEQIEGELVDKVLSLEKEENNAALREQVLESINAFLKAFDEACRRIGKKEANSQPDSAEIEISNAKTLNKALDKEMAGLIEEKDNKEFLKKFVKVFLEESGKIGFLSKGIVLSLLNNSATVDTLFKNLRTCLKSADDDRTYALDNATVKVLQIVQRSIDKSSGKDAQEKALPRVPQAEQDRLNVMAKLLFEAVPFARCKSEKEVKNVFSRVMNKQKELEFAKNPEKLEEKTWGNLPGRVVSGASQASASLGRVVLDKLGLGWVEKGIQEKVLPYTDAGLDLTRKGVVSEPELLSLAEEYVSKNMDVIVNLIRELFQPESSLDLLNTSLANFNELLFAGSEVSGKERARAQQEREQSTKETSSKVIAHVWSPLSVVEKGIIPTVETTVQGVIDLVAKDSTVLYLLQKLIDENYLKKIREAENKDEKKA